MHRRFLSVLRIYLFIVILGGMIFPAQTRVFAASSLTVSPITWNVVGLDSNDVNAGPNNFPVGVRACNPAGSTTSVNNVSATFVWLSANANINLRSGSLNPINPGVNLAPGACYDFYFEVTVTRTTAAWNTTRQYRIDVAGIDSATSVAVTASSPTPREIYVEKLVSQNRNAVTDVKLNGVSVAAGGTMNLLVGSTYTIELDGATATNGYEQIESFINFPNTIFRVNSVVSTYAANAGTDATAASKLYADGCGWVNDPTSGTYRSCTGAGKYGGNVTITYNVTIIGGGGTNQTLNTLIYDFSGSSYHYNSDFSTSYRTAIITDPGSCTQSTITQWTFTGDTVMPSTGSGTIAPASVTMGPVFVTDLTGRAASYDHWTMNASQDGTKYIEISVSTVGYTSIHLNFDHDRSAQGPTKLDVSYSTSGTSYTSFNTGIPVGASPGSSTNDLSSIAGLNNNTSAKFRLFGYAAGNNTNGTLHLDNVTVTGCQMPASINLTKNGAIDPTVVAPANQTNVGDRINYTLVITNNGGGNLTGVTLIDTKAASLTCTPALSGLSLSPGQSTTCTGTYTLTQADFDTGFVTNTATANSTQAGPVTASANQTLPQAPALTLLKSTTATGFSNVGEVINYSYLLTNSGNVTLFPSYGVSDNKTTVTCPAIPVSLAPTVSVTCTASYTVVLADITGGSVLNNATGTAKDPSNNTVTSNTSSVTVNVTPTPTPTNIPTHTPTDTPTSTLTDTPTNTPTSTPTDTPKSTPTNTPTSTPTDTPALTSTPTDTPTNTPTNRPTDTSTSTPTDTATSTPTDIPTNTPTNTPMDTPTSTATDTPTSTPTNTPTNMPTSMATTTSTPTPTSTATHIPTPTPVVQVADPALSKSVNPLQASVGDTVTFTLKVTNKGTAPASGVVITDVLPSIFDVTAVHVTGVPGAPGSTLVSVTPLIGTGTAPYTVVVTLGADLSSTDVVTIQIVTTVNGQGNPPINNQASLTTSGSDSILANDIDSVAINVRPSRTSRSMLPATGFAKGITTILPSQPENLRYSSTDVMLEIPSLSVKIPVVGVPKKVGTWNITWLGDQAGWLQGTAFPSWSGNSVLTGHVYLTSGLPGPFVNLYKLKFGDNIIVHAYGQKYTFEVQSNQILKPDDATVMQHEEKPWLTLVTCKDYDEKTKAYRNRVVVRAVLVKVDGDK